MSDLSWKFWQFTLSDGLTITFYSRLDHPLACLLRQ